MILIVIGVALALVIGLVVGALGGGGSVLTLPVLIYALGVEAKSAVAASIVVVGIVAAVGAVQHARSGNVVWRKGLVFGVAAMVGAYGGGLAAGFFSGTALLLIFAALMLVAGLKMAQGSPPTEARADAPSQQGASHLVLGIEGLIVGAVTGLVGAGGGFIVVPVLVYFGGFTMRKAIGTSLMVIAMKSFTGVLGHLAHAEIPWGLALGVAAVAVVGVTIGSAISNRLPQQVLKQGFGVFVLAMAVFVVYKEAPAELVADFPPGWPLMMAATVAAMVGAMGMMRRHRFAAKELLEPVEKSRRH